MAKGRIVPPLILAILLAACSAVPSPGKIYVVEHGDTLSGIASDLRVNMSALARANGLAPPYRLTPGQRLAMPGYGQQAPLRSAPAPVPAPRAAVTQAPPPATSYSPVIQAVPNAPPPSFSWPGDGALTGTFGQLVAGKSRNGIELSLHPGQRIVSAAAGTVLFAGAEPQKFGQLVIIDHGGGWFTAYGFSGQVTVTPGEAVTPRERIGVGDAGNRKLHFELRRDNIPRDPLPYLPPRL